MELDFSKKEKIVGTFMITVTVLLLVTVVIIGRGKDWFKTYIRYYTVFDEGYNLQPDTPVKLFSADIGKVKDITEVSKKLLSEGFITPEEQAAWLDGLTKEFQNKIRER